MNKALLELAEIHYGKSPKGIRVDSSSYPIFGTGGQVGYAVKPLFKAPGIVVGRKGTLGNPIFSPDDFWAIDTTYAVLPKSAAEAKWIYYNLLNYDLTKLNEATGVPSINRDYLYQIKFCYFELEEQRKIAEILTTVDGAIEQTEALIRKYQRIKQGLMQDLLTRGVDENGELRPYPNMRPDLYKRSELGWIPTGWKIQKISEFAIVKGGKRLPVGAQFEEDITPFPYIRVTDFYDFTVDPSSIKYISTDLHEVIKRYVISVSDVYISIAGTIGLTGTIPEKLDGANLTENAARITQINGVNNRFLAYFLGSYLAQKQISALIGTTTQPKLALERIEQIRVLIPNYEEQIRIIKVLNEIIGTIDRIQKEQKKLLSLKQGLMQDLLTGKVRVNALLD